MRWISCECGVRGIVADGRKEKKKEKREKKREEKKRIYISDISESKARS